MSELSLLILASVGAALAFFAAGLLLRRRREGGDDQHTLALELDLQLLRADHQKNLDALAEARRLYEAEVAARKGEAAARVAAERERDSEKAEHNRLAAREKTLADRLHAAEEAGQTALDQVESNAAAWDARWQAAQAECQRQEQALKRELEQLRAARDGEAKEHAKLVASTQKLAAEKAEAQRLAAEAARTLAAKDAEWQTKLATSEADGQARRAAADSEWQAKLAAKESELQLRAQTEVAGAAKQTRAEVDRLTRELDKVRTEHQSEREQRQRLELVARATEEALAAEQALAKSSGQAARAAEARLRELDRLGNENAELRAECHRLTEEAKLGAGREGEAKDVRVELAAAQAKLAELEQVIEENRRLRDEVAELKTHQEASGELERLTAAHKQLRLDAELMARRLDELTRDQAELAPLRAQAADAAALQQEVEYLRRREKDLEAQLYASGYFASREMPAVSGELCVQTPVTDMETSLDALLVQGGPRTAVLADGQGFLIAGAGESMAQEGLAAFAGVAGDLVARARMLLPLADVDSIRLTDANRMVLSCHLFDSDGQSLEIATLGPGEPPAEDTQRTIAGLAATLSAGDGKAEK